MWRVSVHAQGVLHVGRVYVAHTSDGAVCTDFANNFKREASRDIKAHELLTSQVALQAAAPRKKASTAQPMGSLAEGDEGEDSDGSEDVQSVNEHTVFEPPPAPTPAPAPPLPPRERLRTPKVSTPKSAVEPTAMSFPNRGAGSRARR